MEGEAKRKKERKRKEEGGTDKERDQPGGETMRGHKGKIINLQSDRPDHFTT